MNKKEYILPKIDILVISSGENVANSTSLIVNNANYDYTEGYDEFFS